MTARGGTRNYILHVNKSHGRVDGRSAAGEPFYLAGETGAADFERRPLPATGEVLTRTEVDVAAPDFGPVDVTGQLRGVDGDDVAIGRPVELAVGRSETAGDRVLVLEPA